MMPTWDKLLIAAAALIGIASGAATLHARAVLSASESRIAVLEAQRVMDHETVIAMKIQIGDIHRWMLEERSRNKR